MTLDPDEQKRFTERRRLQMAAIPKAIAPYYSLAEQVAVPLYAGPLLYPARQGEPAEQVGGTVSLRLTPAPKILMRVTDDRQLDLNDVAGGMRPPHLPPMSTVPDAPEALSKTGNVSWPGSVNGYVVGKATAARRVTFHLVDFMPMVGTIITDGVDTWTGRVTVNVDPWVVTIDGRPDLDDVLASAGERGGYVITHTCSLERRDGRPFAYARCQEMLTCLTWCLWFCRASGPSVVLPVGFDSSDRAMWSHWAAPYTDPLPDHHWQWFDKAYGAKQLSTLLPLFWQRYRDPIWRQPLQLAIRYYSNAAVMGTLQRNVILAQVGLESLAYAYLVMATQQLQHKSFKPPVSKHIRDFLCDVKIPIAIPQTFYGLRRVRANKPWDGPAAVAWLRNDIVHGSNHKVHAGRWRVWNQGWQLAVHYLELAILAVVGYDGCYRNRLSGEAHVGAVEPVPWAV